MTHSRPLTDPLADIARKNSDLLAEAQALDCMGNVYHALGDACSLDVRLHEFM